MAKKKQKFPHLVGSKWTACQTTWGWRHFQVVNRKQEGKWVFAEMVASCDPQVRFWLNATQLKNNNLWQPGWKTLAQIRNPIPDEDDQLIIAKPTNSRDCLGFPPSNCKNLQKNSGRV